MRTRKGSFGNQHGAVFVTVALAIPLIVALIFYVSHMYRVFQERARMQELADAAAIGAAAMQARGLNAIALMNDTLLGIEGLAAGVFLGGNAAAGVLDALVVTAPEGVAMHQETFDIIQQLSKVAGQVAEFQDAGVEIFEFTPLLAAQLPLLFEELSPKPLLLPFPLPGMQDPLSLALPSEKRNFGFENLLQQVNQYAVAGAQDALKSVNDEFEFGDRLEEGQKACKAMARASRLKGKVAKFFGANKPSKESPMLKGCQKVVDSFPGGNPITAVGKVLGELLGRALSQQHEFPPPLVLNQDYTQKYQVAVLAVRCKPWADCDGKNVKFEDFNFSIAQARSYSDSQREGGDLLIADFSARLVPVTVLDLAANGNKEDGAANLQSFLSQGPWAIRH